MADPLKWQFDLLDKMSGPAQQIAKAVGAACRTTGPIGLASHRVSKKPSL